MAGRQPTTPHANTLPQRWVAPTLRPRRIARRVRILRTIASPQPLQTVRKMHTLPRPHAAPRDAAKNMLHFGTLDEFLIKSTY